MSDDSQHSASDMEKAAIGKVLGKVGKAFGMMDASIIADCYTEDADWTNAFGTTLHGRDDIIDNLERLFAD